MVKKLMRAGPAMLAAVVLVAAPTVGAAQDNNGSGPPPPPGFLEGLGLGLVPGSAEWVAALLLFLGVTVGIGYGIDQATSTDNGFPESP